MHHCIGILGKLLPQTWMVLQVIPQFGMVLDILLTIHERRILADLPGQIWMRIEELVKGCQLLACEVRARALRNRILGVQS